MPLKSYGVLKGKATAFQLATASSAHFQVQIQAGAVTHRIAINAKSSVSPPEVLFYMDENFAHPLLKNILDAALPDGYTPLPSKKESVALDYIRRNLFATDAMKPIPFNKPGADNDLNEKIGFYADQAVSDADAVVYAFGEKWGPEPGVPDKYFHFEPGNGIHDIHMNQGNSGQFKKDNGVYQDGGLFIHFPSRNKWIAIFIAFQVQAWHTDDQTGNPLTAPPPPVDNDGEPTQPGGGEPQPETETPIRIIAALVNPKKDDPGKEYVLLLNISDQPIDVTGWKILDRNKKSDPVPAKVLASGDTLRVNLTGQGAQLSNNGGIITLLNQQGLKIHGVSYTNKDADRDGYLVAF